MGVAPNSTSYRAKFTGRRHASVYLRAHKARDVNSMALSATSSCQHVASSNRVTNGNLIQQAINNDPNAQADLLTVHRAQLYRRAYAILRNREDAEDALQDCWLRALKNLHSFRGRSSFSTWLTRIVINSALMILRKRRNPRELSFEGMDDSAEASPIWQLPSASPNPEENLLAHEAKKILERAICGLRPRIREVIEVGQLRDLSTSETAEALGISMAAAKGRLCHARATLRKSTALKAIALENGRTCCRGFGQQFHLPWKENRRNENQQMIATDF
jgi:RNA polymerase sigma-70 factor, ECF subfamily